MVNSKSTHKGEGGKAASLARAATYQGDDIANQHPQLLIDWMRSTPKTPGLQNVKGLAGGVLCIMEGMGGVAKHHRGVNDFFTVEELRCRLLQQAAQQVRLARAGVALDQQAGRQQLLQVEGGRGTFGRGRTNRSVPLRTANGSSAGLDRSVVEGPFRTRGLCRHGRGNEIEGRGNPLRP